MKLETVPADIVDLVFETLVRDFSTAVAERHRARVDRTG
jgi:hypothetical protein